MRTTEAVQWHWIITVQYPATGRIATISGVVTVDLGTPRDRMYHQVLATVEEQMPGYGTPVVLFYSINPNHT